MIYGIIVSIIEGKQVASVCSFKFLNLNHFEIFNEKVFKPTAEKTNTNSSLFVCTSLENLIDFCQKTGTLCDVNNLCIFNP